MTGWRGLRRGRGGAGSCAFLSPPFCPSPSPLHMLHPFSSVTVSFVVCSCCSFPPCSPLLSPSVSRDSQTCIMPSLRATERGDEKCQRERASYNSCVLRQVDTVLLLHPFPLLRSVSPSTAPSRRVLPLPSAASSSATSSAGRTTHEFGAEHFKLFAALFVARTALNNRRQ